MDSQNTTALYLDPRVTLRQVAKPVQPAYCMRLANDTVAEIAQYYDLDHRPLVSTAMVPIPSKPRSAIPAPFDVSTYVGDPSASNDPPPFIPYGY